MNRNNNGGSSSLREIESIVIEDSDSETDMNVESTSKVTRQNVIKLRAVNDALSNGLSNSRLGSRVRKKRLPNNLPEPAKSPLNNNVIRNGLSDDSKSVQNNITFCKGLSEDQLNDKHSYDGSIGDQSYTDNPSDNPNIPNVNAKTNEQSSDKPTHVHNQGSQARTQPNVTALNKGPVRTNTLYSYRLPAPERPNIPDIMATRKYPLLSQMTIPTGISAIRPRCPIEVSNAGRNAPVPNSTISSARNLNVTTKNESAPTSAETVDTIKVDMVSGQSILVTTVTTPETEICNPWTVVTSNPVSLGQNTPHISGNTVVVQSDVPGTSQKRDASIATKKGRGPGTTKTALNPNKETQEKPSKEKPSQETGDGDRCQSKDSENDSSPNDEVDDLIQIPTLHQRKHAGTADGHYSLNTDIDEFVASLKEMGGESSIIVTPYGVLVDDEMDEVYYDCHLCGSVFNDPNSFLRHCKGKNHLSKKKLAVKGSIQEYKYQSFCKSRKRLTKRRSIQKSNNDVCVKKEKVDGGKSVKEIGDNSNKNLESSSRSEHVDVDESSQDTIPYIGNSDYSDEEMSECTSAPKNDLTSSKISKANNLREEVTFTGYASVSEVTCEVSSLSGDAYRKLQNILRSVGQSQRNVADVNQPRQVDTGRTNIFDIFSTAKGTTNEPTGVDPPRTERIIAEETVAHTQGNEQNKETVKLSDTQGNEQNNKTVKLSDTQGNEQNNETVKLSDTQGSQQYHNTESAKNCNLELFEESAQLDNFDDEELWEELRDRRRVFDCTCGLSFGSAPLYFLHRACHNSENDLQCSYCGYVAPNMSFFHAHFFLHQYMQ